MLKVLRLRVQAPPRSMLLGRLGPQGQTVGYLTSRFGSIGRYFLQGLTVRHIRFSDSGLKRSKKLLPHGKWTETLISHLCRP